MANPKPTIIGLYGLPGSGKTTLLRNLQQSLGETNFAFFNGSTTIASIVPGGLPAFQALPELEKHQYRTKAITHIASICASTGRVGIVAGHLTFWDEKTREMTVLSLPADLSTYTHIVCLSVAPEILLQRRRDDISRSRPPVSLESLRHWQAAEEGHLRIQCQDNGIIFSVVTEGEEYDSRLVRKRVEGLVREFAHQGKDDEKESLAAAMSRLDGILASRNGLETAVVIDGDKTLAAEDTGALFWQEVDSEVGKKWPWPEEEGKCPLKHLFGSRLGYSHTAFRQAMLLYEDVGDDATFDAICDKVATRVTMHAEFAVLLRRITHEKHITAMVVTCGLRHLWEKVLQREGLSETVKVIGTGRLADGVIITADVKAALVTRLRDVYKLRVWAFGDSPLDLPMFARADEAIVVVGEEHTRSKTMDVALKRAVEHEGLRARQLLIPTTTSPRLDTSRLPTVSLNDPDFLCSILLHRSIHTLISPRIVHATDRGAAKLLMAPMRDARVAGPALREAHRRAGWYLATEFLSSVIGLEEYAMPHVQGNKTRGHRLLDEHRTTVVALMRGGEPMALGVSDVFPRAMFVHAREPEDLKGHHVHSEQGAVLLVDSVVNSGKTVVEFVRRVRALNEAIQVLVVAGVVQIRSLSESTLADMLRCDKKLSLVALRLSENKYTGRGGTDTGNRLFNTTHVD